MNLQEKAVVDAFHNLYYNGLAGEGHIFQRTTWMNVPCAKCPLDLWIYQEIIAEIQPDLIIETGTYLGGSALFMAHMLDIVGKGEILTIDVEDHPRPSHPRIKYLIGSSVDWNLIKPELINRPSGKCLIMLDSDHRKDHVLKEMNLFARFVSVGSYLIVEDTNVNGHPAFPTFGDGPYEAVEQFLKSNSQFIVDKSREKFLMTSNPHGYLRRVA